MLQACFIILTLALAIVLYLMAAKVSLKAISDPKKQRSFIKGTAVVLVLWLIYVSAISVTGIFSVTSLPPRIPIFLVIPAVLFFIYFFTATRFKGIIAHTPPPWIVYLQSFRIVVQLLIWWLFMKGIFPLSATFEGYNYDIFIGFTAPFVAYFTFIKPRLGTTIFVLWNIAGLATLLIMAIIVVRHSYFPCVPYDPNNILAKGFGTFPYTFLPGFFMPLAVFLHIFSLIQARNSQ